MMLRLSRNPTAYTTTDLEPEATSVLYLICGDSQVRLEFYVYQDSILMMACHKKVALNKILLSPVTRSHAFKFDGHECTVKLIAMHLPQTIDIGLKAPRAVKAIRGEIISEYDLPHEKGNLSFSPISLP